MDISQLQHEVNQRWPDQTWNRCSNSRPSHALVHMMKALGKVADAQNEAEHAEVAVSGEQVARFLADLVICAARFAGGCSGSVDLDAVVQKRLAEKFPSGCPQEWVTPKQEMCQHGNLLGECDDCEADWCAHQTGLLKDAP